MRYGFVRHWPWWKDLLFAVLLAAIAAGVVSLLQGCASAPAEDPRDAVFDQHLASLGRQMDAGTITRKEAASSARTKARELFNDPYMDELWAYRVMLADQVERGETTTEQAAYLDQRKVNEIMERVKTAAPSHRPTFRPSMTCRPDGYGGVRCR